MIRANGLSDLATMNTACRHAFGARVWYSRALTRSEKFTVRSTQRCPFHLLLVMLIVRVYEVDNRIYKRIIK